MTFVLFLHQVTRAQEEERKRIARELHDDTAQTIAILGRELDEVLRVQQGESPDTTRRLVHARDLATQTLTGIRRFSHELRPPMLDDLGLAAALDALLVEIAQPEGISTRFEVHGEAGRLNAEAELTLYRIAQEAIRNAQKHAASTEILVVLEFSEGSERAVHLSIVDDGIGFELRPLHSQEPPERRSLGLIGMHERAALLAARLEIESAPGRGTRIDVTYPSGEGGAHP